MKNMAANDIFIDETDNSVINSVIKKGIIDYNAPFFGSNPSQPFTIYIKDLKSEVDAAIFSWIPLTFKRDLFMKN